MPLKSAIIVFAALLSAPVYGQPPQAASRPADVRPRIAVAGMKMAAGSAARDAWMATAIEETLAWRLRRADGLIALPTARVSQALRELANGAEKSPPLARAVQLLGATSLLTGTCSATASETALDLSLSDADGKNVRSTHLAARRVFDLIDQATRWTLSELKIAPLDEASRKLIFAPPCQSPSALEYYAKAVLAARSSNARDVSYYLSETLSYDRTFREALLMQARLALLAGRAGRLDASRKFNLAAELARRRGDELDLANAETGHGVLDAIAQRFASSMTRFETALRYADTRNAPYAAIAVCGHVVDLQLSRAAAARAAEDEATKQTARKHLLQAAEWQERQFQRVVALNDTLGEGAACDRLAAIYEALQEWDKSLAMHQRSLAAATRSGVRGAQAAAWMAIGQHHAKRKQWAEAIDATQRCLKLAGEKASPAILVTLGGIYRANNQLSDALREYQAAYERIKDGDDLQSQLVCLRETAKLQHELGQAREATKTLQQAIDIAHVLNLPEEKTLQETMQGWRAQKP